MYETSIRDFSRTEEVINVVGIPLIFLDYLEGSYIHWVSKVLHHSIIFNLTKPRKALRAEVEIFYVAFLWYLSNKGYSFYQYKEICSGPMKLSLMAYFPKPSATSFPQIPE